MYPKLREYRRAAGLSQVALARQAGLSKQYYSQLESGQRGDRWGLENARAIAFVLADKLKRSRNRVFADIFLQDKSA